MRFNKVAVQHELDLAANELEKSGHSDLAERVDYYSERLVTASDSEFPLIRRALSRIQVEAERRNSKVEKVVEGTDMKAKIAVLRARRASEKRNLTLNRIEKDDKANKKDSKTAMETLKTKTLDRGRLNARLASLKEKEATKDTDVKVSIKRARLLRMLKSRRSQ